MNRRTILALCCLFTLAACRPSAPPVPLPEVRVFTTVPEAAAAPLLGALEARRLARPLRVASAAQAELLWLGDPTEVIEAGPLVAAGPLPALDADQERLRDPKGRFVPVGARARVFVVSPKVKLPMAPAYYRDLADRRLAGRQALASPGGANLTTVAALSIAHGEQAIGEFLRYLARAQPHLAADDAQARRLVAGGECAFALVSSVEGAAGAMSSAGLRVIWPDQNGKGAVVLPTAAALTAAGASSEAARRSLAFLVTPEAEQLLVARAPGFLPLRAGVLVPEGVTSVAGLEVLELDWDRLAAEKARLAERLARWP